jgi:hypothetical protein
MWMKRKNNCESSPEIRRNRAGVLMQQAITHRVLNRNSGYERYKDDAEAEGYLSNSKTHFYLRNKEMGLVDSKSEAGLCPNCIRHGTENWAQIKTCIEFLYQESHPERSKALDKVDRLQNYSVRGGPFCHSLQEHSVCVDWCCRFALSDPFDDDLQSGCDNHDHTERDSTVIECDELFRKMIYDSQVMVANRVFSTTATVGEAKIEGVVKHLRSGSICIAATAWSIVNVSCDHTDLNHLVLNLLSLTDLIRKCIENHVRYRRHLYLDRDQSYGEMQMNKNSRHFVKQDYMMKIRPKQWQADCSVFHLMMSKGQSVSVFCYKGRIDAQRLEQLRRAGAITVDMGDYILIWIDSFGSNTTQGGYETLCVEEASLRKLKLLCPWVTMVDFASDAGSGYTSTQTLLGLRNAKALTGIRVRYVHFNASGEGKRWETDGHNTDIKVRREQAMRAGQPVACCTPATEVQAQLFGGGIEGSFPVLLSFDYDNEVAVKKVGRDFILP